MNRSRSLTPATSNVRWTAGGPGTMANSVPSAAEAACESSARRTPLESKKVARRRSRIRRLNPADLRSSNWPRTSPTVLKSISPTGHMRTASRSGSTSSQNFEEASAPDGPEPSLDNQDSRTGNPQLTSNPGRAHQSAKANRSGLTAPAPRLNDRATRAMIERIATTESGKGRPNFILEDLAPSAARDLLVLTA